MASEDEEFAMVFNEIYPSLCRFLECMVGGRERAQDIAQESFLQLYRTGWRNIGAGETRFWLYRVARNLALNELSKGRTRQRLFGRVVETFSRRTPDPEEEFEMAERKEIVLDLLKSLPEQQRAALLLREQEEMSYRDIAGVLEVSESKVKVDVFRARTTLRAKWNKAQSPPAKL
jgi:RNA polymerase sigma factor (sigma-70 family)